MTWWSQDQIYYWGKQAFHCFFCIFSAHTYAINKSIIYYWRYLTILFHFASQFEKEFLYTLVYSPVSRHFYTYHFKLLIPKTLFLENSVYNSQYFYSIYYFNRKIFCLSTRSSKTNILNISRTKMISIKFNNSMYLSLLYHSSTHVYEWRQYVYIYTVVKFSEKLEHFVEWKNGRASVRTSRKAINFLAYIEQYFYSYVIMVFWYYETPRK